MVNFLYMKQNKHKKMTVIANCFLLFISFQNIQIY